MNCVTLFRYGTKRKAELRLGHERKEETECRIKPIISDSIRIRNKRFSLPKHLAVSDSSIPISLIKKSNNTKQDFQDSNPKEIERTAIRASAPYTFFRLCVNLL